jgi:hypothetical protein
VICQAENKFKAALKYPKTVKISDIPRIKAMMFGIYAKKINKLPGVFEIVKYSDISRVVHLEYSLYY